MRKPQPVARAPEIIDLLEGRDTPTGLPNDRLMLAIVGAIQILADHAGKPAVVTALEVETARWLYARRLLVLDAGSKAPSA